MKRLALNVGLPSALFLAFLDIQLERTFLYVALLVFAVCVGLWFYGRLWQRRLPAQGTYFPFMMTGFEYGMLGIGLFGTVFGLEKVGYIAVVDLGHEFFIWFVFLGLLLAKRDGRQGMGQLVRTFAATPVIGAIVLGLLLNIVGGGPWMQDTVLGQALQGTLSILAQITVPLILLIIGYGLVIDRRGLRQALQVAGLRLAVLVPGAYLIGRFVFSGWWGLAPLYQDALFTLVVLPPPFIVPLYIRSENTADLAYTHNILAVHTVISVCVFSAYIAFRGLLGWWGG